MMKSLAILLLTACVGGPVVLKMKPVSNVDTQVQEPSDICYFDNHWYMVSDKGLIYEVDLAGKILKTSSFKGSDLEGIYRKGDFVYVTDERLRQVHVLNAADLAWVKTLSVPFPGPRNSGYEGICYNEMKKCWMLAVEKEDPTLLELNDDFQITAQYPVKGIADISSITWYKGHVYMLSDEDHQVWELDPKTLEPVRKFSFKILNPEGVAFNADGRMYVVSDDMQMLFKFNPLP